MSDEIGGDDANDDFYSADAWAEPPVDDFPETILVASSEKSTRDANRESSPRDHDLRPVRRRSQSPSPRNPTFDRRQWHSRSRSKSPSSQRFRKRGRWGDSDDQHNGNTGPRDRGPESFSTGQFEDAPRGGSDHRRGAPRPNHRDGQQQQQQQQQQRPLEVFGVYNGVVARVEAYGAFVKLQGLSQRCRDGLVHSSQFALTGPPPQPGQEVGVKVLSITEEQGRQKISLSLQLVDQVSREDLDPV
eukprot:CAMPEP_0171694888 /NCGR_PEP_ID=MMETSP0991-20121206/7465_1 /TAXON_ID=483369 /ORGANISM="non described non described, Strain CCMP2098" /LENGTH=244 /DNA_ID=CAMNT_0012283519 /DNA_START=16 /DNA_END=747 /DNA_ORIENTATION=+